MDAQKESRSVRSRAIEFVAWAIGSFLVAAVLGTASPLGAYGAGVVAAVIAVAVLFGRITLPVLGKARAVGLIWLSFVLLAGTAGYQVQLAEDKRLVAELAELRSTDVDAYLERIRDEEELWLTELESLRPEAYEEEVARRERDAAEAEAVRIAEIERRREEREAEREAIRAQEAEQAAVQAQNRFEAALARAVAEVDGPLTLPTSMEDIGAFLARVDRQAEPFVLVADASPTPGQLEQLRALRAEVTAFQEREFPRVRDALGPLLRRALWIDDTTARTTGPGFRTLELTSYRYTLNRNIQADFDPVRETLIQLRFSNVMFREFEDGPGSRFTLDHASPADDEILIWRGGLPRRAASD